MADGLRRLDGLDVHVVGVHCPLDTIVERRRATGYPTPDDGPEAAGAIDRWQTSVHRDRAYDLEFDTSCTTPDEAGATILRHQTVG